MFAELFDEELEFVHYSNFRPEDRPELFSGKNKRKSDLFFGFKGPYKHDKETLSTVCSSYLIEDIPLFPLLENYFGWFPEYFQLYRETTRSILNSTLPKDILFYLAIIGAATYDSFALVSYLEDSFLEAGGDPSWLQEGLNVVPSKVKAIAALNNILAFCPWIMTGSLLKEQLNSWTHKDLLNACIVMTQFQKLSSLYAAFDISVKSPDSKDNLGEVDSTLPIIKKEYVHREQMEKSLKDLREEDMQPKLRITEEDLSQMRALLSKEAKKEESTLKKHQLSKYRTYANFAEAKDKTLFYMDFNWEDHAYYVLQDYEVSGSEQLNAEFQFIESFTSERLGNASDELDTLYLRLSMCNYVEFLFGYMHEDFDYGLTNRLLTIFHKQFIKYVVSNPRNITGQLVNIVNLSFTKEEIFHLALLVSIIKQRVQLNLLVQLMNNVRK